MLNTATIVAVLVSTVLPLISSLISSPPVAAKWPEFEGIATTVLAAVTGFFAEWAHAGSGFDWKRAAGIAALSLLTAFQSRARIWAGSAIDAILRAAGSKFQPADPPSTPEPLGPKVGAVEVPPTAPAAPHPMPGPGATA